MMKIISCLLVVFLLLSGCADTAPAESAEYSVEAENESLRSENERLREENKKLAEENAFLISENESLADKNLELEGFRQKLFDYHVISISDYSGPRFARGCVEVRATVFHEAPVTGTLENMITDVILTILHDDELWSLVSVWQRAEGLDTHGWVLWDELEEYDPDSMEKMLTYPVRIREGTILHDERSGRTFTSDGMTAEKIEYKPSGEIVILEAGGREYAVEAEDIIYPTVSDGVLSWEARE